jgi:hypothetical protein
MTKPRVHTSSRNTFEKPTRPFQQVQADIMVNWSTTSWKVSSMSWFSSAYLHVSYAVMA